MQVLIDGSAVGPDISDTNKLSGNGDAAGPRTTF